MEKAILSKSTFIKGEQCHKALFLYKKRYFLRDKMPPERVAVFTRGTNVGLLAQQFFPNGIDCKSGGPRQYSKAVEKTINAINHGHNVLYEAAFIAHSTLIYLDILVKKDNEWHAFEVKSSIKISETYLMDASLQNYIIRESGLNIKSFNIIYINENYELTKEIDLTQLFIVEDVTQIVNDRYNLIRKKINEKLEILKEEHSPKIDIGVHCRQPYDCDFIGYCWKNIPKKNLFNIPSLNFDDKFNLIGNSFDLNSINFESFEKITIDQIKAQLNEKLIVDFEKYNEYITSEERYCLIKILSYKPAIPLFDKTKPYENILFGYHIKTFTSDHKKLKESIYLTENQENPSNEIYNKILLECNEISKIYSFSEYDNLKSTFESLKIINLREIFSKGIIAHPKITGYSFIEIYNALQNKVPWYKKLMVDKQAGLEFEKLHSSSYKSIDAKKLIEDYLIDSVNHMEKLYHNLIKINQND